MTTENRKLDMSLDEIIRMDGIKGARRGGGGFSGNRRRGGTGGQMSGGGDRRRYEPKRLNNNGPYNRGNRGSFGGQQSRYQQSGGRGRQMNGFRSGGNRRNVTLHVSNLAASVNTEDVEELFSTFGVLVKSYVHYDQYGTSVGTAEVIFEQRDDAVEAKNKLNSVPLDGKPLRIVMIDDDGEANGPFSSYLRSSQQRDHQQHRNGGGGGGRRDNYQNNDRSHNNRNSNNNRQNGGGGRSFGRRDPKPKPATAEDLDNDIDNWRMQVDGDTKEELDV